MKANQPIPPKSEKSLDIPMTICEVKTPGFHSVRGPSAKIEVRESPIHGYGVFAKEKIAKGELIEELRLLALQFRSKYSHDTVLRDYVWSDQSCSCDECNKHGFKQYLALGCGSLYNHSDIPNTLQVLNFTTEVMTITARENIMKDEEIFVTYGELYWVLRKFWKDLPDEAIDRLIKKTATNSHL